ncbi:hypothetical protein DSN97_09160 [Deferribacteraceae bacterium V6Fe1]|nr:hypothetical protein DSN97_09160 [Deferribacteraceae bacterium V6Fe1]
MYKVLFAAYLFLIICSPAFGDSFDNITCIKILSANYKIEQSESIYFEKVDNITVVKSYEQNEIKSLIDILIKNNIKFKPCKNQNLSLPDIFELIPTGYYDNISAYEGELNNNLIIKDKVNMQPYAELSLEILNYDKDSISNTLNKYNLTLPYRDKLEAEIITGQIQKAYDTAYDNSIYNNFDYLSYKQNRDLYINYANNFSFNTEIEHVEDISRITNKINLKKYLYSSTYMTFTNTSYYTYDYKKDTYLIDNFDELFTVGILHKKERLNTKVDFGLRKSIKTFPFLNLSFGKVINSYFDYSFSLGLNTLAEETNYIFYGGAKDYIKTDFNFKLNNKNTIAGEISLNKYNSQERNSIGFGENAYLSYTRKLRIAYPDYTYYIYTSQGLYNEKDKKIGSILKVAKENDFNALPDNFVEVGIGFQFGLDYYNLYNRQWRPFLDTSLGINNNSNIGYSIFTGIGGSIFKQDNFALGIKYGRGFFGQAYNIYNLEINYNLWF